jgi:hypothetical protein
MVKGESRNKGSYRDDERGGEFRFLEPASRSALERLGSSAW